MLKVSMRSIVSFALSLLLMLGVISAQPAWAAKPITYTPAQLQQIEKYRSDIAAVRQQMPALANLIENRDWTNVRSLIHGPFGELRREMSSLGRLLKSDSATTSAKDVFVHLEEIDEAASLQDYRQAIRNYAEAIKDFEAFLSATAA